MKILSINKFFHINGGVEREMFEYRRLLIKNHNEIADFSMQDDRNFQSKWSNFFVSNISFEKINWRNAFRILSRMLFSFESKNKITRLLKSFLPDIVHIRAIDHQISPSILLEFKKRNIPIIQTLGSYHIIAPNYFLFHNNSICEITKPNRYYKAFFHKCVKNSYFATSACVLEMYFQSLIGLYPQSIDYFISPSMFMKNKLVEYGFAKEKIYYLPQFIDCQKYPHSRSSGKYVLYFGRISQEKGIEFLLKVISKLPKINFIITGQGPLESYVNSKIKLMKLRNVELTGFKNEHELIKLISCCRFSILPSLWYDNLPNSILESQACERPVVASRIGGIPEIIEEGVNGYLFEPGNLNQCIEKINNLWNDIKLVNKMGRNARERLLIYNNPDDYYDKLMEIYSFAIKSKHL